MQIYLLRHGIAEDGDPGQPDSARELTDEGRARLRRVLKRARMADVNPSLILSSPYRRAVQTADVAVEVFKYQADLVKSDAFVPGASPAEAWDEIRLHKDQEAVLVASHEPLTGLLAAFLLGCPALHVDVKKAALIRIDVERFGAAPGGVLKWMLTPGLCIE